MPRVDRGVLKFFAVQRPIREEECYVLDVLSKTNTIHVMCLSESGKLRYLVAPSTIDIKEVYVNYLTKGRALKIRPEVVGGRILRYDIAGDMDLLEFYTWLAELVESKKIDVETGLKIYNVRSAVIRLSPKGIIIRLPGGIRRDVLCSKSLANVEIVHSKLDEERIEEAVFSGIIVTARETYVGAERELVRAFVPMSIDPRVRRESTVVDVDLGAESYAPEEFEEERAEVDRREIAQRAVSRIQQAFSEESRQTVSPSEEEELERLQREADEVLREEMEKERRSGSSEEEFVEENLSKIAL